MGSVHFRVFRDSIHLRSKRIDNISTWTILTTMTEALVNTWCIIASYWTQYNPWQRQCLTNLLYLYKLKTFVNSITLFYCKILIVTKVTHNWYITPCSFFLGRIFQYPISKMHLNTLNIQSVWPGFNKTTSPLFVDEIKFVHMKLFRFWPNILVWHKKPCPLKIMAVTCSIIIIMIIIIVCWRGKLL